MIDTKGGGNSSPQLNRAENGVGYPLRYRFLTALILPADRWQIRPPATRTPPIRESWRVGVDRVRLETRRGP